MVYIERTYVQEILPLAVRVESYLADMSTRFDSFIPRCSFVALQKGKEQLQGVLAAMRTHKNDKAKVWCGPMGSHACCTLCNPCISSLLLSSVTDNLRCGRFVNSNVQKFRSWKL